MLLCQSLSPTFRAVRAKKSERLGAIDDSPPERVPYEEYDGEQLGAARLLFPIILIRLEKKVDASTDNVLRLVDSMQKFTETFQKLIELQQLVAPNSLRKGEIEYV